MSHGKVCAVYALLLLYAVTPVRAWQNFPAGQPVVQALAADSSGQKIFVGLDSAGLWLTENGGTTWLPISTRLNSQGHIDPCTFLAADAAADTVMGLTTCFINAVIPAMSSFDGGNTWQESGTGPQSDAYMIHPRCHNLWFRAERDTLDLSQDYGQTWNRLNCSVFLQGHLRADALYDSVIYYTGYSSVQFPAQCPGVSRTTDWGVSWAPLLDFHALFDNDGVYVSDILRLSGGDLLMAVKGLFPIWPGNHLVRSTDNGATWARDMSSPAVQEESRLYEAYHRPGRLFLSDSCAGAVLRSDDNGHTWTEAQHGLPSLWTVCTLMQNSFSGELFAIYKGQGVYHTRDDGETWTLLSLPPVGVPRGDFSITPNAVFFRSEFFSGYDPLPVVQHALESPYTDWRELAAPDTMRDSLFTLGAIFHSSADTLLALAEIASPVYPHNYFPEARVVRSGDNGLTWEPVSRPPDRLKTTEYFAFRSGNATRLIVPIGYYADSLALSEDLGLTWEIRTHLEFSSWWWPQKLAQSDSALYMFVHDRHVDQADAIYRSTDTARTWQLMESFDNGLRGFVVFGDTVHSVNHMTQELVHWIGGSSQYWGEVPQAAGADGWYFVGVGGAYRLFVIIKPEDQLVWVSSDLGMSWREFTSTFPYPTQNLRFGAPEPDPYRQRIWMSVGTGVCYLPIDETADSSPLHWQPADYNLLSVYPNPFNGTARIRFALDQGSQLTLRLYDITGRLAADITQGYYSSGHHEVLFDANSLASGVYVVQLQAGTSALAQKLMLLK